MTYEEAKDTVAEILRIKRESVEPLAKALAIVVLHSDAVRLERPPGRTSGQTDSS